MRKQDQFTPDEYSTSRTRWDTEESTLHRVRIFAILALALVMLSTNAAAPIHAQAVDHLSVVVTNPKPVLCLKKKQTYHVRIKVNEWSNPNDPLDNPYLPLKPGLIVSAEVADPAILTINSPKVVAGYSPDPDLASPNTLDFTFTANKVGTTNITFKASMTEQFVQNFWENTTVESQADDYVLLVDVKPCQYKIFGEFKWTLSFGGGIFNVKAYVFNGVKLALDDNGKGSAAGQVIWYPEVTGPPCSFPYSIPKSAVKFDGETTDSGTIKLTMTLGPAATQKEVANCQVASNVTAHTLTFEQKEFEVPFEASNPRESINITSPEVVGGAVNLNILPDESGSGQ